MARAAPEHEIGSYATIKRLWDVMTMETSCSGRVMAGDSRLCAALPAAERE
ncbi:MAG: hypothetical protein GY722_12020 [bacterium]|nr:hypothetical protein [bacterium]